MGENLSPEASRILLTYNEHWQNKGILDSQTIGVGQVLSKIAFLYERVRNAVDYKGDHLLRRNAIERIIRRQLWESPNTTSLTVSESLMKELIWARYFQNHSITTERLRLTATALEKYFYLLEYTSVKFRGDKKKEYYWRDYVLSIASSEVEEILDPSLFYIDTFSEAMFSWFKKNFSWESTELNEEEQEMQIYVAVHRSLPKSDEARLRYHLLKKIIPNWNIITQPEVEDITDQLFYIFEQIEDRLQSPIQKKLYRFVQKRTAPFQIFKQIMEENREDIFEIISDKEQFSSEIERVADKRYEEIGKKVQRGIIRSIIYIFVTKVFVVLLIEIPFEIYVLGHISYVPMLINILLPAFLMFLVGLTITKPGKENTERINNKLMSFVYEDQQTQPTTFTLASNSNKGLLYRLFVLFYVFLFILTFGGITYILVQIGFNILSSAIFFMFLSLVLLFSYRVRYSASELKVTDDREGLVSHLINNLTLPFLNLGVWLSSGLRKLNFIIVFMDFLIEAPLKTVINIFEDWSSFIKEKKEEVVEVPVQ